jgi:hypothetical protein
MASPRICAADDCNEPFDPVLPEQLYHSERCAARMRQRRRRAKLKPNPRGGGPGGDRQPRLFSRSELHRRKPAKSALKPKPKQDGLFPEDGIHATQAIGYGFDDNGKISDLLVIGRTKRPPARVSVPLPEAPLAA